MNWQQDKSIKLSRFCVYCFTVVLVAICIFAPYIFTLLINARGESLTKLPMFLISVYTSAIPAAAVLFGLHKLLKNIDDDKVFIQENVSILRRLSWYCIIAGAIYGISILYYLPFLILCIPIAFIGLILRVVKNIFAEAVRIKNENDYTI